MAAAAFKPPAAPVCERHPNTRQQMVGEPRGSWGWGTPHDPRRHTLGDPTRPTQTHPQDVTAHNKCCAHVQALATP